MTYISFKQILGHLTDSIVDMTKIWNENIKRFGRSYQRYKFICHKSLHFVGIFDFGQFCQKFKRQQWFVGAFNHLPKCNSHEIDVDQRKHRIFFCRLCRVVNMDHWQTICKLPNSLLCSDLEQFIEDILIDHCLRKWCPMNGCGLERGQSMTLSFQVLKITSSKQSFSDICIHKVFSYTWNKSSIYWNSPCIQERAIGKSLHGLMMIYHA